MIKDIYTAVDAKIVVRTDGTFGGSRIAYGQTNADLWSDGVVIAGAWSMSDPLIGGTIFSFRGTLTRTSFMASKPWMLRDEQDRYVDNFATRRDALAYAERSAARAAFRALNEIEAAR